MSTTNNCTIFFPALSDMQGEDRISLQTSIDTQILLSGAFILEK